MTKKNRILITSLIKWKKNEKKTSKLHEYMLDTFKCFCVSKQQISLDLFPLSKAKKNMVSLVMNSVEIGMKHRNDNDKTNLFRQDIFDIFNNVKIIEIDTFAKGESGFTLSLTSLLSLIKTQKLKLEKIIIKAPIKKDENNSWLSILWSKQKHLISTEYDEFHYKVSIKRVSKRFGDEDWFIIQKDNNNYNIKEEEKNDGDNKSKKKKSGDNDLKIALSMDSKLGKLIETLPFFGTIKYEAPNKFWSIQMGEEWQAIREEFSKLTDELYSNEEWYKKGIERGNKWAKVLNEENAEIITIPPTSLSGAHITLGRVDINSNECPKCFIEGKHIEFEIDKLVCHPPFRDIPKNLPGQIELDNGYRFYATHWIALGVKFINFPYKTRFPPHVSLCNIAVKLKIDDVDNYENIKLNSKWLDGK
eukprot:500910_1